MKRKMLGILALSAITFCSMGMAPAIKQATNIAMIRKAHAVGDIFTYEKDENNKITITLISETECKISLISEENEEIKTLPYKLEENTLTVIDEEEGTKFVAELDSESNMILKGEILEIEYECSVVISGDIQDGTIKANKTKGHPGDVIELEIEHDPLYVLDYVAVNGTNLVPNTETGKYSFKLIEGENKVTGAFKINETILNKFSGLVDKIKHGEWTEVFSLESVVLIIGAIVNSGILAWVIKYFVKDKKQAEKIAQGANEVVKKTCEQIIPNMTKETVEKIYNEMMLPLLLETKAELNTQMVDLVNANQVFARCFALAQENTPESKMAIINELGSLKVSDQSTINDVKAYMERYIQEQTNKFNDLMLKLQNIEDANKAKLAEGNAPKEEVVKTETENVDSKEEQTQEEKENTSGYII